MPKYVDEAKKRIGNGLRKYSKIIAEAQNRGVNEADTRDIVKAILGDVLGYDPFFDVTGEYSVKGQYADFGVKIGDQIRFFVEVKSVGTKLEDKQMFQIIGYAANKGHEWGVLTNGDEWNVYRLFTGHERGTELVLSVSLTDSSLTSREKVEQLFMISQEGFRQNALSDHWSRVQVLNPSHVSEKLLEPSVLRALRREVQRGAGFYFDLDSIAAVLLNQVIRGDLSDKIKASGAKNKQKPKKNQQPNGSPPVPAGSATQE